MSGRLTVWGAGELLTNFFGNGEQAREAPGSHWLALVRAIPPTAYMSGAEIDEPDATDYTRVEIANDLLTWSNASSPQTVYNQLAAQFPQAVTDWGVIRFWALTNALKEGFNYLVGELEQPLLVEAGDTVRLEAGDLGVSLGPFFTTDESAEDAV